MRDLKDKVEETTFLRLGDDKKAEEVICRIIDGVAGPETYRRSGCVPKRLNCVAKESALP